MKKLATIGLCALLGFVAVGAYAQTQVKILSMTETRKVVPETKEKRRFSSFGAKPGVEFELELVGPTVASAIKYGNVKITAAADDKGTDLMATAPKTFGGSRLQDINRKHMYFHEKEVPTDKMKFKLNVGLPLRSAATIKFIRGSVDLLSGKKVAVSTPWEKLKEGTKIENALVTKAGLVLELKKVSPKRIDVKATGTLDDIVSMEVLGADGKKQTRGGGWSGWNNTRTYNLSAESSYGPGSKLVISILKDKKLVSVPISLKDVKLK